MADRLPAPRYNKLPGPRNLQEAHAARSDEAHLRSSIVLSQEAVRLQALDSSIDSVPDKRVYVSQPSMSICSETSQISDISNADMPLLDESEGAAMRYGDVSNLADVSPNTLKSSFGVWIDAHVHNPVRYALNKTPKLHFKFLDTLILRMSLDIITT